MSNAFGIENNLYDYNNYSFGSKRKSEKSSFLEEKLQSIEDEQGIFGKAWNGLKEFTNLGVSASDCESMLDKYNKGEISFEEAVKYLDDFDSKQENMSGLLSNILTGVGAIALATPMGAGVIGWKLALMAGAPIGAAIKTTVNTIDRATNEVEGDALDAKQMAKDAISGAITGMTSAISSSSSVGFKFAKSKNLLADGSMLESVAKGALCGVECGAISGSTSYMTDVAFGDREYNTGDLVKNAATSALVSGAVGGVIGAGIKGADNLKASQSAKAAKSSNVSAQNLSDNNALHVFRDSFLSSTRKVLGLEVKDALDV